MSRRLTRRAAAFGLLIAFAAAQPACRVSRGNAISVTALGVTTAAAGAVVALNAHSCTDGLGGHDLCENERRDVVPGIGLAVLGAGITAFGIYLYRHRERPFTLDRE
ncbi:MAG: hypothetical protein H6709_24855 [Kofleriaceae bacterium]|nr:hypothetical protein [Myxococcales bacterium]MCB9563727.1 hypothetical protein [Kofleriaceae bacterium]MCB9565555.1 hypothetical protein [Kofleriaceae bacterium]MCB9575120.1 hypothetical protein [Kofleriaceae bacterium]MCB9575319.1 hypothetical protein [Kofleriaceae bacterium]